MKELSIEEKAKRYDEAIAKGKQIQNTPYTAHWDIMKEVVEHLFPELKESEDERIRKALIQIFNVENFENYGIKNEEVIAWLEKQGEQPKKHDVCNNCDQQGSCVSPCPMKLVEKQGEQNLAEWTAEDEEELKIALNTLEEAGQYSSAKWLKNVCLVPQTMQKPTEWSEEDRDIRDNIIRDLKRLSGDMVSPNQTYQKEIQWLKSLKEKVGCEVNCTTTKEWSREDEQLYNDLSDTYFYNDEDYPEETYKQMLKRVLDWMNKRAKSLRSQNTWKPSEEQITVLHDVAAYIDNSIYPNQKDILVNLYLQLKKLRNE